MINASFLARIYFGVGKYLVSGIFGRFLVEVFHFDEIYFEMVSDDPFLRSTHWILSSNVQQMYVC